MIKCTIKCHTGSLGFPINYLVTLSLNMPFVQGFMTPIHHGSPLMSYNSRKLTASSDAIDLLAIETYQVFRGRNPAHFLTGIYGMPKQNIYDRSLIYVREIHMSNSYVSILESLCMELNVHGKSIQNTREKSNSYVTILEG